MNPVMDTQRNSRLDLFVITALVLLTAAVYGQVMHHGFIVYDDPAYLTENYIVRKGLTGEGVLWAFATFTVANWHPLTWLSHMLDVQLFGMKPGMHHLVSVFLHILNTVLLFWILRQMTGALWRSAFAAALFALHPLHVESVVWAAERKDVLSTLFWILTMGAYARYARKPGLRQYGPVLLFFALGLMAKPMLVTLPAVLLLLDGWPLGRLKGIEAKPAVPAAAPPSPGKKKKKRAPQEQKKQPLTKDAGRWDRLLPLVYEKIPLLILSAASSVITFYAQQKGGAVASLSDLPLAERAANAVVAYSAYLWKTLWPSGLAVIYPLEAWPAGTVLASAALLLAVTAVAVRWSGAYPYLLVGWLWYVITLAPVIGIVKVGSAAMADRYTYVSLVGPFVALSWGIGDLSARWNRRKEALTAAGLLVVGALAALTFVQTGHWKNSDSLFRHAIAVTENNYTAHTNLAVDLIGEGRLDEALSHLEAAVRIKPDFSHALYNIGTIRIRQGDSEEALLFFLSAIRYSPDFARAYRSLAFLRLERGETAEAVRNFEIALARGGPDPQAYSGLADSLAVSARYEEALVNYGRSLALKPDAAEVHYNAARVLIALGRLDEAISHLQEATRLKPDYARAHNNLGSALLFQGKIDDAIRHFQEAVRIDPDYRIARENLQDALAQKKLRR